MTKDTLKKENHRRRRLAVAVVAVILVAVVGFVTYTQLTLSPVPAVPTVYVTLYGGLNTIRNEFGFSNTSAALIDSPGPTLTFKVGDVVKLTFINADPDPNYEHNWAMIDARTKTAGIVFNAQTKPVPGGSNESTIFTVSRAGNYFYACNLPNGDIAWGMWGNVVVNP
jgi:plastocyanin